MVTLFSLEVSLSSVYTRVQELYSVVSTVLDQQPSPPTPLSVRSSCHFSCTQLGVSAVPSLSETTLYLKYSSDLLLEHSSQIEVVSFPGRFSSVILRDNLRGARIEAEHFLFICFIFYIQLSSTLLSTLWTSLSRLDALSTSGHASLTTLLPLWLASLRPYLDLIEHWIKEGTLDVKWEEFCIQRYV